MPNLPTYGRNETSVTAREAEVTAADFDGGMNLGASNAPGIGIGTGKPDPKVEDDGPGAPVAPAHVPALPTADHPHASVSGSSVTLQSDELEVVLTSLGAGIERDGDLVGDLDVGHGFVERPVAIDVLAGILDAFDFDTAIPDIGYIQAVPESGWRTRRRSRRSVRPGSRPFSSRRKSKLRLPPLR